MITSTRDNRIRISRRTLTEAGFQSGDQISVIRNTSNSFSIVPMNSTAARSAENRADYRVECDGRTRISNTTLRNLGIRARRKSPACSVDSNRITISL
jgi:hypothetical protein